MVLRYENADYAFYPSLPAFEIIKPQEKPLGAVTNAAAQPEGYNSNKITWKKIKGARFSCIFLAWLN